MLQFFVLDEKKNSDKMAQAEFRNPLKMKILEILVSVILILEILYVIQWGVHSFPTGN
ncbi:MULTISPECIES: hypothetical protein [unclassified Acinetobacter]|uniref:hypothetical protein n=1 Tax=unclassified Acinetobacter TaxID=196816 RepID=UPI0015D1F8AA|nr:MULTISPECIES: hypothetical protein [unclassified Acinetobacter]